MKSGDLPTALLQRKAVVYVRQSSPNQVINNPESQRRQYELVEAARHPRVPRCRNYRRRPRPHSQAAWRSGRASSGC